MSRTVRLATGALAELDEAARWYGSQRRGLGHEFLEAVEEALASRRDWPSIGTPVETGGHGFRRMQVGGFPYHLPYRNFMDRLRPIRRVLRGIEASQVRWFGRSLLSTLFRTRALVLETVGRRSGQPRQTALAYHRLRDGDLVIVGGAGGQRRIPDWVANVRANPDVHVVVERVRRPMTAVELVGDERTTVWEEVRGVWPQIDTYEQRAGRPVPVLRLTELRANGRSARPGR